ncbi:TolC family protein [Aestuariivivens marinum]|uniref:TolC family protein n=1 Tax=Aestuariivivens marinum TaxID=2913555 RepID=UPI001F5AB3B3|nr:TolC family protein [Aestuariivivens marinum]
MMVMKLKFGIKSQVVIRKYMDLKNKIKYVILNILYCVFFITAVGFSQDKAWTLQECIDYALEHNITVKQGKNNLLLNNQDIKAAQGNFLPSLGIGLSQSLSLGQSELFPGNFVDRTFHSTSAGLSISQSVFNGFRNTYIYKQAELNLETNQLELDRIKDDIALNVVNAYLNVLFNKENLEIAQAQYEFSDKQLEQVKALVDAGVQPKANIYDAEATLSRDAQQVTISENNFNLALLNLSQLLQLPYEGFSVEVVDVGTPSESLLYSNVSPILDYALANRVEIKVAEKNIENALLNTEISKAGYYPTVSLGYGFNTGANFSNLTNSNSFFQQLNENKGHSFNLRVNIPIFSRYQNQTAVAKSKIQVENSKLNLEQAKINLESNVQRAYTDAQAAFKAYEAAKKTLASQELAFNNAKERFDLGNMSAYDLEQSRVQYINAQSSLINAKYDFVFKTKVLDFYMDKFLTH